MTFQIYWGEDFTKHRGYTMFDIEYYQTRVDKNKWQSEIHVLPCVEGLVRYTFAQKDNPDFYIEDFIRDSEEIQELRGWLWERDGTHNQPSEDSNLHYGDRYKYIDSKLHNYAEKYGLYVSRD